MFAQVFPAGLMCFLFTSRFRRAANTEPTVICMVELNDEKVKAFTYAVKNDYWYQMYIDGLPIWGKVGEKEDKKFSIYTHKRFDIGYNGQHIVDINLTTEKKELLTPGAKIKFTYEVNWKPSPVKFADRFDKYLDPNFFQHRVSPRLATSVERV